jgi:hypothetical protein
MSISHAVPLLARLSIGVLLAVIAWGVGRLHPRGAPGGYSRGHDDLLLSLLVFAICAAGVFVAYALFDLGI